MTADFYHRWSLINEKDSLLSITTLEHGSKHIKSFDPDHFEDQGFTDQSRPVSEAK